jgi:hypothetical protein
VVDGGASCEKSGSHTNNPQSGPVRWDDGRNRSGDRRFRSGDRRFRSDDVCLFFANAPKPTDDVDLKLDVRSSLEDDASSLCDVVPDFSAVVLLLTAVVFLFLGDGQKCGHDVEPLSDVLESLGADVSLLEGVVSSFFGDVSLFLDDVSFSRHDGHLFVAVVAFLGDDVQERVDDGQEHGAALHSRFESVGRQYADGSSIPAVLHKRMEVRFSPSAARSFSRPNAP